MGDDRIVVRELPRPCPIVRLLLERGADPTIVSHYDETPLMAAASSINDNFKVVRLLLDHPSAKGMINHRHRDGQTALWEACRSGLRGMVRALLVGGADPTIAKEIGGTPMAVAIAQRRLECIAELEVRFHLPLLPKPAPSLLIS
jgi:ankyrin repeat protein